MKARIMGRDTKFERWPNQFPGERVPPTLAQVYNSGISQKQVALHFGVSQSTVCRWMKKANLIARSSMALRDQWGDKNPRWKGLNADYATFHRRVEIKFGKPKRCDVCGTTDHNKLYDWANLTKNYHDLSDYKRMCRSCHRKYDNSFKNFHGRPYRERVCKLGMGKE